MKVQLVSFQYRRPVAKRIEYTAEIINSSTADLILFPGHTLLLRRDVTQLLGLIANKAICALIETKEGGNHPYLIKAGKAKDLRTSQWFSMASHINNDFDLCEDFLNELESKRIFQVDGRKCLLLQCGENNIVKNYQRDGNRAAFRFDNIPELSGRFDTLLSSVDIILNPAHTPMGNQGKLAKRRELLSSDGRAYFLTCNADEKHRNLLSKSIQYAYSNAVQLHSDATLSPDRGFILRQFEI